IILDVRLDVEACHRRRPVVVLQHGMVDVNVLAARDANPVPAVARADGVVNGHVTVRPAGWRVRGRAEIDAVAPTARDVRIQDSHVLYPEQLDAVTLL